MVVVDFIKAVEEAFVVMDGEYETGVVNDVNDALDHEEESCEEVPHALVV